MRNKQDITVLSFSSASSVVGILNTEGRRVDSYMLFIPDQNEKVLTKTD